jgi:fermentation-respiration switch protein FrsA (DUF1100 family)
MLRFFVALPIAGYLMLAAYVHAIQRQMMFPAANWGGFVDLKVNPIDGSERLTLKTGDGETLAAWYRAPARQDAPVVLFFHGNGGGLEFMDVRWDDMAERGWGVLALSYRGYPGSTGKPSEAGLASDARTAYDWLRQRHPAENIVLHGFSLGTGVAVTLAAEVDARALILEAPFLSAIAMAKTQFFWLPLDLLMADPFRSDERIASVGMPVLVVHGTFDEVVPFAQGGALFERAAEPKSFLPVRGGTHGDLPFRGLGDAIEAFLSAHPAQPAGQK